MTEKRFVIDVETENYENAYFENGKFLCYEDDYDAILKRLNELAEENITLKKDNETLKIKNKNLIKISSYTQVKNDSLKKKMKH